MRTKAFTVFEGIPQDCISGSADEWQTEQLSGRYRGACTGTLLGDCRADETGAGNYRIVKGRECLGMGRQNE